MKKLFTLCLLAVTMCAVAQKKTVAVYVTGDDSMNQILGDRLVDGIAQSGKYTAVERTASFLQELSKEQNYQHTGAVDDDEISRVGKQFGVNYVCVATVLDVWEEKYLTSRLIDVETAEVVASSSSSGQIASSQQFIAAMNTLSNGLLNTLAQAQEGRKKVAVYVTKTGNKDVDIILGDKLVAGFAQSGRFCAVERTNGFLKQLGKEQTYQQSGAVDDRELSRLGKQFGVDYVCIAKTSSMFGDYFITSRLIDVETGEVANSDKAEGVKLNNSAEVVAVAKNIAKTLSGMTIKEQEEAKTLAEEARKVAEEKYNATHQNGYEFVDLGLSVKWATMNLSAKKAEDYGGYYYWGGLVDCLYSEGRKIAAGSSTILPSNVDAASVNWGGSWRIPTDDEFCELREKCLWTWTTQNGVNGYKVTSKTNNNSIFLPAAGYRGFNGFNSVGAEGNYWSSSLCNSFRCVSFSLSFDNGNVRCHSESVQDVGISIRAVCP